MKSEKGITLTSLVIYICVATIVISSVALISSYFFSNVTSIKSQSTYAVEYNKFNMFFLQDVKTNSTANVTSSKIVFADNTEYEYKQNAIYRNNTKIANNVKSATFTASTYEVDSITKNLITVNLDIGTGSKSYQKEIEYVLKYW